MKNGNFYIKSVLNKIDVIVIQKQISVDTWNVDKHLFIWLKFLKF